MKKVKKWRLLLWVLAFILLLPINVEAAPNVKLNKKKATIYIGSTANLKISGTRKKVKWSSGNKKVATVNSRGRVTPRKTGKVRITARVSGKKYTCNVTVKKPFINTAKKSLKVGETYILKLTGTGIVSASSGNKRVAVVSSKGKITAKGIGKAVITLKGKNRKKYKCTLTVVHKDSDASAVMHEHSYVSAVIQEATCSQNGIRRYRCACGAEYDENIEKLSHNWEYSSIFYHQEADRYISYYRCSMCCGEKEQYDKVCNHIGFVNRELEVPATCAGEGIINCQCQTCTRKWVETVPKTEHSFEQTWNEDNSQMFECNVCATVNFRCVQPAENANTAVIRLTEDEIALLPEGVVMVDVQREILSGEKWDKLSLRYSNPDIMYPIEEQAAEGAFKIRGKKAGVTDFIVSYDGVELMRAKITVGLPYEEAVRQYYNGNTNVFDGYPVEAKAVVTGAVDILREIITADMTDYEKAAAVTDWFAANTNGGPGFQYGSRNLELYGVLGEEVHAGNTPARVKAFSLLLSVLDIPVYAIAGTSGVASYPEDDMWAAVYMDTGNGKGAQWYYVVLADGGQLITDRTVEEFNAACGKGVYETTIDYPIITPGGAIDKKQYQAESSKRTGQLEYSSLGRITGEEFSLVH